MNGKKRLLQHRKRYQHEITIGSWDNLNFHADRSCRVFKRKNGYFYSFSTVTELYSKHTTNRVSKEVAYRIARTLNA